MWKGSTFVSYALCIYLGIQCSSAFSVFETKLPRSQRTDLALTSTPLPFFSKWADPEPELKEGKASVTLRLPLGKIFDSRDYIFSTKSNIRSYEWTQKEAEELLDDFLDAAAATSNAYDYELSQIILIATKTWDKERFGLGNLYDVYDGQQRLVTICFILRALQLSFEVGSEDLDTATELKNMLQPPKVRKENILRIDLTPRDQPVLEDILTSDQAINVTGYTTKTIAQSHMVENFGCLYSRVTQLSSEQRLQLLDYMIEHVHLLVCIPESAAIARNIVMGQGKGKDNEVIDDFKGLVCFRYIQDEAKIYQTFDAWDDLSSTPDLDNGSVGRATLSDACLLRAEATLRTKIGKRSQLLDLERWLRQELQSREADATGDHFYRDTVSPAAIALGQFREGSIPPFGFSKGGKITKLRASILSRLEFLRELCKGVSSTKEVEMVVLELLIASTRSHRPMPLTEFEEGLHLAEQLGLWAALVRPSSSARYRKVFQALDMIEKRSPTSSELLTQEDLLAMQKSLITSDFGATANGKRFVLSLLKRINHHMWSDPTKEFSVSAQYFLEPVLPLKATKKAWGKSWPEKSLRDAWVHRLGNLCLVSKKAPTRDAKASFEAKKERLQADPLPLTQKIGHMEGEWDRESLVKNFSQVIALIESIWGIKGTVNEVDII